jgi:hypothetical protein
MLLLNKGSTHYNIKMDFREIGWDGMNSPVNVEG